MPDPPEQLRSGAPSVRSLPTASGAGSRCVRCPDGALQTPDQCGGGVGPLSSWPCSRCGGGFIPQDGASRLFEELSHTPGELRELAALVGGARLPCPGCRSQMSPLQLRGAALDVCFGCGGLWVDSGDLEAVSSDRYQMPVPSEPLAQAGQGLSAAQSLVRIDERPLQQHITRAVLAGAGAMGLVWCLVGILPLSSGMAALVALAAAAGLSRRQAFDVLPRARRMMRWRGFFAPSAADDVGAAFPSDCCVVVRRQRLGDRPLPWVTLELVDAEGRSLVRLHGPLSVQRAWIEGPRYARALGVTVRFDVDASAFDALDVEEAARGHLPSFARIDAWRLSPERTASARRGWTCQTLDGALLGTVTTDVPSPATHLDSDAPPEDLDAILAEHLVLEDTATKARARLYSTTLLGVRATIVIGPAGEVLGHVTTKRSVLADQFTWTGPQGRRQLTTRIAHGALAARILDAFGRDVGALDAAAPLPGQPRSVTVHMQKGRATGDGRWGLLALVVHASLASIVDDL